MRARTRGRSAAEAAAECLARVRASQGRFNCRHFHQLHIKAQEVGKQKVPTQGPLQRLLGNRLDTVIMIAPPEELPAYQEQDTLQLLTEEQGWIHCVPPAQPAPLPSPPRNG